MVVNNPVGPGGAAGNNPAVPPGGAPPAAATAATGAAAHPTAATATVAAAVLPIAGAGAGATNAQPATNVPPAVAAAAAAPLPPNIAVLIATLLQNQQALQAQVAAMLPLIGQPAASAPVIDLQSTGSPYNLAHRDGLSAYKEASEQLDHKYNGSNATYPNFLNALQQRARKCFWSTANTSNITTIAGKDLFTQINSISEAELQAGHANRVDDRAKQNSKALYETLSKSIDGDLYSSLFNQAGNLPTLIDGPLLFKFISRYTTVNTMTAAAKTSDQLTNLDPVVYKFNIVEINQVLGQLFICTSQSPFGQIVNEDYKIFWVLKTYEKIKRPREWYDFVLDNRRDYKRRLVTDATDLMADATSKYNKLAQFTGEYTAATTTVEQSVVVMMTTLKKVASAKRETSAKKETYEGEAKRDAKKRQVDRDADPKPPPFFHTHQRVCQEWWH